MNKLIIKALLIKLLLVLFPALIYAQLSNRQIRNLEAFSRIYGYVQYFHPADEAKTQYWNRIAVNGSNLMLNVKDDEELIEKLRLIYEPIAPTIRIYPSDQQVNFNLKELTPPDITGYKEVSWQHLGLELYSGEKRPYYSIRLNRRPLLPQKNDFEFPLTQPIDVGNYKGLPFDFSVLIAPDTSFHDPLELNLHGIETKEEAQEINRRAKTRYHFNGIIPDSVEMISFTLQGSLDMSMEIDSVIFRVYHGDSSITIPTNHAHLLNSLPKALQLDLKITANASPLFNERLTIGDHIDKEIVEGISLLMPLVLYGNEHATYPLGDSLSVDEHEVFRPNAIGAYYNKAALNHKQVMLGDVIILWNILRHSFPYWHNVSVSPEEILQAALQDAYSADSPGQFIEVIEKMCSVYNDAHMFISIDGLEKDNHLPPIILEKINNDFVVKDVLVDDLGDRILPGDLILEIDGLHSKKRLDSCMVFFSGSVHKKESLSLTRMMEGRKDSAIEMKIQRGNRVKDIQLERNASPQYYVAGNSGYLERENGWITPDIYYFDLTRNTLDSNNFSILKQAKSIIFDLRGYVFDQTISVDLIPAIIGDTLMTKRFFVPEILYPDYENVRYDDSKGMEIPNKENHLDAEIIFLTDVSAQSASESLVGLIKDFKLGVVIGSNTSGTNGDINLAYLPGNLVVCFSGMLVKNSDGSPHHLIGVIPDILVTQSVESITKREDRVLERAVEYIHSGK